MMVVMNATAVRIYAFLRFATFDIKSHNLFLASYEEKAPLATANLNVHIADSYSSYHNYCLYVLAPHRKATTFKM